MTTLDRIDELPDGTALIRFRKDDGRWHRTSIPPGVSPELQLDAVDVHLQAMARVKVTDSCRRTALERVAEIRARKK